MSKSTSRPGPSGHKARKRFGQNFLEDPYTIQQIVSTINPQADDRVVEIGPGLGALTQPIIDQVAAMAVVELDRDLIPHLKIAFATRPHFRIFEGDALRFDFTEAYKSLGQHPLRIIGNLPYNISTPLMFRLADFRHLIADMHFMLQKEVVDRLAAGPGDNNYGRLGIMMQYYFEVEACFVVPPEAFNPRPRVDSAIVRLRPHAIPPVAVDDLKQLNRVVTQAFSQRRKTLRNALKPLASETLLEAAGIAPDGRAETIELAAYARLANIISQQEAAGSS